MYSLNFHVIDIKHLFHAIDCYIILESVFLSNTWAGQQYQYLKHGGDNPVAIKKITVGQVVTNFTGQVVASCAPCARACVCGCVCVCARYKTIVVYTIHHRKLSTCMFILKENV